MGFLISVRDETDDEGEIEAERRALRDLWRTFRVKSQIELPNLEKDEAAQRDLGRFIAQYSLRKRAN